jgi:NAD(P)-dependent dehydrogenase (short-subunit alcohol dehydrogenase family)
VAEGFGRIDVLVHNAARCVYDTPLEHSDEGWRALLQVNALAAASLTRALAPCLPDRTGQLVALGSVVSEHLPNTRFAPYAVSKAALDAWVAAVRLELAPRGVRTLLLRLGLVDTPIYEKVTGFERTLQRIRDSPSEWLTPDDVVEALLWATDQPAHVAVSELTLLPRGQAR